MIRNTPSRYGLVSKFLHWLGAFLMIGLIWLGWWMVGLDYYDPFYGLALTLHRSFGMVTVGIALAFVAWKVVSPSPAIQERIPRWQRLAAHAMHGLLLCMMIVIPASGYLLTTSAGSGFVIFGSVSIPAIIPVSDSVRDWSELVHYYASYGLLFLVGGHAGAAVKHQFLDGIGTLRRMI